MMKQSCHNICGYKVCLTRKPIKHIYLRINRETSDLRVSAPVRVGLSEIENFIRLKKSWIEKSLNLAATKQTKRAPIFADGQLLRYKGQHFQLRIVEQNAMATFSVCQHELVFFVPNAADEGLKQQLFLRACTDYLDSTIPQLLQTWQQRIGVNINEWRLKTMKTRWGSCNIQQKRIWLNRNLGHYGVDEIEFVIVHELIHLLERYHNERFYGLMDHFLPDWRERKKQLSDIDISSDFK